MSSMIAVEILAAERKRCDAMLANDNEALDALLDERLQFSHATGAVDDKPAYLAKMAAGRIVYTSIDWSEGTVIALGDEAALLTGRMVNSVTVEGAEKQLKNRVITAWAKSDGEWRLVAFQSTPLKD
ncbi:MAG: nuclear transport factor 2 family protein [Novosphingobium sp.]|nr:nuclear transport factor 2 family protein [Novosphingobium sp.]